MPLQVFQHQTNEATEEAIVNHNSSVLAVEAIEMVNPNGGHCLQFLLCAHASFKDTSANNLQRTIAVKRFEA